MSWRSRGGALRRATQLRVRRGPVVAALACAALRTLIALYFSGMGAGAAVLLSLGGAAFVPDLVGSFDPFMMLLSVSADILLCYLLSSFVPDNLEQDISLALPRTQTRDGWASGRCVQLVALVALYELTSAAGVLVVVTAPQQPGALPDAGALVVLALWCALVGGALLSALVLWINLIALVREAILGFVALVGVHVGVLIALATMPSARMLVPWFLSARGLPAWHRPLCELVSVSPEAAVTMSPLVSFVVLSVLSLVAARLLVRSVRRADVL
jgi:hypothetical protein